MMDIHWLAADIEPELRNEMYVHRLELRGCDSRRAAH